MVYGYANHSVLWFISKKHGLPELDDLKLVLYIISFFLSFLWFYWKHLLDDGAKSLDILIISFVCIIALLRRKKMCVCVKPHLSRTATILQCTACVCVCVCVCVFTLLQYRSKHPRSDDDYISSSVWSANVTFRTTCYVFEMNSGFVIEINPYTVRLVKQFIRFAQLWIALIAE